MDANKWGPWEPTFWSGHLRWVVRRTRVAGRILSDDYHKNARGCVALFMHESAAQARCDQLNKVTP